MTQQEWQHIYQLVGAAMEVHNELGRGMAESIYQEALAHEFLMREIPFLKEKPIHVYYKNILLKKVFVTAFICDDVIVELKAVEEITTEHRAQLFNYLRITRKTKGLLINFGERNLHCERYLFSDEDDGFILLTNNNYRAYID